MAGAFANANAPAVSDRAVFPPGTLKFGRLDPHTIPPLSKLECVVQLSEISMTMN